MALAWIPWSFYVDKASRIRDEAGVLGLCSRLLHKIASPMFDWGSVTFFVCRLDEVSPRYLEVPPGVHLKQVPPSEILELRDGGDPTQDVSELVQRYRRGDRAFAAIAENGRAAHVRWVSMSNARIPELGREMRLTPGQAYLYNGYTRADLRRRGFDGLVRTFIFQTLQSAGYTEALSYVRRDNPIGLRAASRWQRPVATFWYLRIARVAPLVVGGSRSKIPRLIRTRRSAWSIVRGWLHLSRSSYSPR